VFKYTALDATRTNSRMMSSAFQTLCKRKYSSYPYIKLRLVTSFISSSVWVHKIINWCGNILNWSILRISVKVQTAGICGYKQRQWRIPFFTVYWTGVMFLPSITCQT
jgi:hypothetical protein